jgi:hypothetical protein
MAIPDADPRAKDLDAAFAAAASGPQKPRAEAKTPADVDQDAPFGRADDGSPIAPHGLTKDGRVKRSAGGRPPKNSPDRPRTETPAEPDVKTGEVVPKPRPEPHDWSEDLDGLGDAVWFGLSAVSKVAPNIPVLGKMVPGEKIAAQAFILSETKPRLVAAVNLAAQHNAKAAGFCKKLEGGDGLWALTCMFMVMPVVSISATIWKGDDAELKEAELPSLKDMAERNGAKMDEMVERINAQIAAATQAATAAEPAGQPAAAAA